MSESDFLDGVGRDPREPSSRVAIEIDVLKQAHDLLNSKEVAWTSHPGPWRDARDKWNESVKELLNANDK